MAFIEKTIYSELIAAPALTALISTRVYPLVLPEGCARPAIVIQKISTDGFNSLDGANDLEYPRFQFSCYGESYSSAVSVALQLKEAVKGSALLKEYLSSERDDYEPETKLFRRTVDFMIWAVSAPESVNEFADHNVNFAGTDWNFAN